MRKLRDIPRSWIYAVNSLLMVAVIVVVTVLASSSADNRRCTGILIQVHDTASIKFVTPQELSRELGALPRLALMTPLSRINIDSLERELSRFDKIEDVQVQILANGKLLIDVHPMKPVARVFNSFDGSSFYINRQGKRINAEARYHLDVPVITGRFPDGAAFSPMSLMSLVDFIQSDPVWDDYVSMIKVDSPSDIILVPVIRGQVVNLGDTADYDSKFRRLRAFYQKVPSVKGWECYDTITLKWRGQIVAHRRNAVLEGPDIVPEDVNFEDVDVQSLDSLRSLPSDSTKKIQ